MAKDKDLKKVHETEQYIHYDFPGVKEEDFKKDEWKTVSIPGGHKMLVGRLKKTDELTAARILIKRED